MNFGVFKEIVDENSNTGATAEIRLAIFDKSVISFYGKGSVGC